jgi:hypothetical protein
MSASTTTHTVKSTNLILTSSKDWDDWMARIRAKAVRDHIWKYIDPEASEPKIPEEPQRPELPADDAITADQRATYAMLVSDYKHLWQMWNRLDQKLQDTANTIESTISRSYASLLIDSITS